MANSRIVVTTDGSRLTVAPRGEIDHHSARSLRDRIDNELYNMRPEAIHYEIADWAIAGNRLPDTAQSLWFYNPFSSTCRPQFPSGVGYWQTRIGDHCFYNPTNAYYDT